jgi:hypothetical protein
MDKANASEETAWHPRTPDLLIARWQQDQEGLRKRSQPPQCFVLSLTDRCNIKCDFCCHPYMDSEVSEVDAIRLVSEAAKLDFDEICVTGGEPLLRKALVLKLAGICREHNKLFGLITNAFWAKSSRKAAQWARDLRDAGVTRVTVSWDPSHGEFVSAETAQNALEACVAEGLRVTLTGSFKRADDRHANYGISTEHLKAFKNFRHLESRAWPAGNGAEVDDINAVPDDEGAATAMRCPSSDILELVVYARDGLTQPCCSIYAGYKMRPLGLGDWRRHSVAELRDRHLGDPFFLILREQGFKRVYQIIEQRDPELYRQLPKYGHSLGVCHFCSMVMQGPIGERVRQVVNAYMDDKIAALLQYAEQNSIGLENDAVPA